ncbi:hypothetical protein [Ralstonia solanacearum]|uniref:hypothetical protein n=1 Tax=Ralstonia solanacearum TaxID=305 RepID=UPI001E335630|nr:hypothetical protein [Ralstonia solanacearum]
MREHTLHVVGHQARRLRGELAGGPNRVARVEMHLVEGVALFRTRNVFAKLGETFLRPAQRAALFVAAKTLTPGEHGSFVRTI